MPRRARAHAFAYPCVDALVAAFVAKGTAAGLDASCVAGVRRPPFVTEEMLAAMARSQSGAPKPADPSAEAWEGVLDVGAAKLRLVVRISKTAGGALTAVVDSPDQHAFGLPVDIVSWKRDALHFEMKLLNAVYDGTRSADGSTIEGRWQQGGHEWPLELKRGAH